MDNVRLTVNTHTEKTPTDFRSDQAWEPTPRFGSAIPDVSSVWDEGDEIRMLYTNGGMWGGKPIEAAEAEYMVRSDGYIQSLEGESVEGDQP